jgi:MoaA/NifB/PqqE/SkfB family radical SAM enzyme
MKGLSNLPLEEYTKLPTSLKFVNLSGGEPFLRPDIVDVVRVITERIPKADIVINTNGFAPALIKKRMGEIIKIKPDIGIGVSIDGIGEKQFEVRQIPGGFEKNIETIQLLKEMGVKNLRIAYTAGDYNIDHLMKVYELSRKLGVQFTIAAVHNSEHYFSTEENKIEMLDSFKKEFRKLIKAELFSFSPMRWFRAYFAYGLIKFVETHKRILPNYTGTDHLYLDSLGNVFPSDVSSQNMGKLQDFDSLESLISSDHAQQAIEKAKKTESENWMICTVRSAMWRHLPTEIGWIIRSWITGIDV